MSASQTSNGGKQCRKHDGHMAFLFHVLLWLLSSYHSTRSNVSVCCYFSSLRWSGGFLYVINLLALFEVRFHCTLSHFALINIPIFQPKPSIKAFGDVFNILFCIFFLCNMKTYIKPPLYAFSSCFFFPPQPLQYMWNQKSHVTSSPSFSLLLVFFLFVKSLSEVDVDRMGGENVGAPKNIYPHWKALESDWWYKTVNVLLKDTCICVTYIKHTCKCLKSYWGRVCKIQIHLERFCPQVHTHTHTHTKPTSIHNTHIY